MNGSEAKLSAPLGYVKRPARLCGCPGRTRKRSKAMRREPIQATIEGAWREVGAIEDAYARGELDQAEWHARMSAIVVPAYLAGDNPRAQSGYSGAEDDWRKARCLVSDAIPRSGTFLDVGCANGLLMESVHAWCAEQVWSWSRMAWTSPQSS